MTASLLQQVRRRIGGMEVQIVVRRDGEVVAYWHRSYNGVWSDERSAAGSAVNEVLRAILDYEDWADEYDAQQAGGL